MTTRISYGKTLGAMTGAKYDKFGLHIAINQTADVISIINFISIVIFSGRRKVLGDKIITILAKANQPISTVAEVVKRDKEILIPVEFSEITNGKVELSYDENGKRPLSFNL